MILCILQFISLPFLIICLLPALESGFLKLRASIKMRFEQLKLRIKYLRCPWLASLSVTYVSVTPKEMFTLSTSLMWLAQIREELLLLVAWIHDYESLCWPQSLEPSPPRHGDQSTWPVLPASRLAGYWLPSSRSQPPDICYCRVDSDWSISWL